MVLGEVAMGMLSIEDGYQYDIKGNVKVDVSIMAHTIHNVFCDW